MAHSQSSTLSSFKTFYQGVEGVYLYLASRLQSLATSADYGYIVASHRVDFYASDMRS